MIDVGPWNQEAEEAVVGAIFLKEELVKECTIRPEQLYSWKLRMIYSAICSLDEKGKPVDVITVVEELGFDKVKALGGVSYISQLAGSVPTTANFSFYEKLVREYDQKRRAIQIAGKIMEQAQVSEISKTLSDGIQELMAVEDDQTDEDNGDITSTLVDLFEDCEKDLGDIVGIPSGFYQLDRLTGGFQESDLVIIGARPSMGKTAFALNLALNAANHDVSLIFSLEMAKKQLLKRMAGFSGKNRQLKNEEPEKRVSG